MGSTYGPVESVSAARANRGPNQWCGVHRLVGPDHIGRSDDQSPCVQFHDEEPRQRTNFPSGRNVDRRFTSWLDQRRRSRCGSHVDRLRVVNGHHT